MPIQTITKEIDGIQFSITEFPVMRALPLKARLGVIIAPALAELLAAFGGKLPGNGIDLDITTLAPAITALSRELKPEEFAGLCRDLFSSTAAVVEGKRIDVGTDIGMNTTFGGQLDTMYKALWAVLDVNRFFGLGSIGKAVAGIQSKATPGSKLPAAS